MAMLKSNKKEPINRSEAALNNDRTIYKESIIIMSKCRLDNIASNCKKQNQTNHKEKWKNLQSQLNNFKNLEQKQIDKIDKNKVRLNNIWFIKL